MKQWGREWDTRIFSIPVQREKIERRMKALGALTKVYGNAGYFTATEAYRRALKDAGLRWCEPSASARELWTEGLLSRRYSGKGNVFFYRVAEGSLEFLERNAYDRDGVRTEGYQLSLFKLS